MINFKVDTINTNKYFIGLAMITLTIGGRFIIGELSEKQKERINTKYFRRLFIFCAFFMATRDIIPAIILTIIASLIISEIINEEEEEKEDEGEGEIVKTYTNFNNLGVYI